MYKQNFFYYFSKYLAFKYNYFKFLFNISFLNQVVNADNDLNKSELIARFKANINFNERTNFFLNALAIDTK